MQRKSTSSSPVQWMAMLIVGIAPLFFLPVTQGFYDTNKWVLLTAGALIILAFWGAALLRLKIPMHVRVPGSILGFGAMTAASFIGLFAASTNKIEALLSPLGPITFLSITILLWAASGIKKPAKAHLAWILYITTGILALIAIYQSLGMGKLMFPGISYLSNPLWTPTGSVSTTITLFVIAIALLIPDMIASFKKHEDRSTGALLGICLIMIMLGLGITLAQFIPNIQGMLPVGAGWAVAAHIFRNPQTAIVGTGVENFLTAFTMGRPVNLNITPLGSVNFSTNANFFFHILTVYGLVGLAATGLLVLNLLTSGKSKRFVIASIICVAALLLVPPTIALLTVIALILALAHDESEGSGKPLALAPWIRLALGAFFMIAVIASVYCMVRAYAAEIYFFQSLLAASKNDGTKTYNLQIKALNANTFLSRYHITYSQTSLSLANSIASSQDAQEASGSSETADSDRQMIAQLVQQAIREAKIAVHLNTRSVAAWENLGLTYQTIIPVATGADNWALTAYESAIPLDPSNPTLFLNIGGVLVHQQQYAKAIAAFEQAIRLNSGYANAYYNAANAYKLSGDAVKAEAALTSALNLVQQGSTDYYKIRNELDAIRQTTTSPVVEPSSTAGPSILTLP